MDLKEAQERAQMYGCGSNLPKLLEEFGVIKFGRSPNDREMIVTRYFCNLSEERKASARQALRKAAEGYRFRSEDGEANIILENLWNLMVGHK